MAQVIWAPKALDDLEALIAYISRDAPATARRFAHKLVARVESLAHHPFTGAFLDEDETHTYRQIIQGNDRVVYRTETDRIIIVAVHHAARLLDTQELH